MNETMNNLIAQYGVVPVVVLEDEKDALPLAEALVKGGLPVAEVTFRTAAAEGSIKAMCEAYPEMLVGAGTVLSVEQVDRALKAGARFIVTPGFDEEWLITVLPIIFQYILVQLHQARLQRLLREDLISVSSFQLSSMAE